MSKSDSDDDLERPEIDEAIPWLNLEQDILVDTDTPWGNVTYDTTYDEALGYDDWFAEQDPAAFSTPVAAPGGSFIAHGEEGWKDFYGSLETSAEKDAYNATRSLADVSDAGAAADYYGALGLPIPETNTTYVDPLTAYDSYVANFDPGLGTTTQNITFDDEIQSLWDKVWVEDSYDSYTDDYMDTYTELLNPYRDMELEAFEQSMFDRGLPEGGDIYSDLYTTQVSDPQIRQDLMASDYAIDSAENARLNDINTLAMAFGLTTGTDVPYLDISEPLDLISGYDYYNAESDAQSDSDWWNSLGTLGSGYLQGGGWWA